MSKLRFTDRINDFFLTVVAAGAVASAVRLGIRPEARDLRQIGIEPSQFPRYIGGDE